MSRPRKEIKESELRAILRMKPTKADCAAFFECSEDTIENRCMEYAGVNFSELRDQCMVHTRFSIIRTAIQKAEKGDNVMLIFCLKNLCGWKDKTEVENTNNVVKLLYSTTPEPEGKE